MNKKVVLFVIIWIMLLIISLQLDLLNFIGINKEYQHAITIEILGSGLIAFIIGILVIFFEKDITEKIIRSEAKNYYTKSLRIDLINVFKRDLLNWNYLSSFKFYFDNSFINSINDCYKDNEQQIWKYGNYINEGVIISLEKIFNSINKAYIEGEKLDALVKLKAEDNYIANSDGHTIPNILEFAFYFCRAKLFIQGLTDDEILTRLLNKVEYKHSTYILESNNIFIKIQNDKDIASQLATVNKKRKLLLKQLIKLKLKIENDV